MKRALFQEARPGGRVKCNLCPRFCNLPPGKSAFCFVRENRDGVMYNSAWGRPTAMHVDPIEKKPLYHFMPGTDILSIGTAGCNLGCRFCQNWDLSKASASQRGAVDLPPDSLVALASEQQCPSIAFTYNEPTIIAEYVMDTAALARAEGIRTVMVTNGYITPQAVPSVYENIDAANVDLKAFDDRFYRKQAYGKLKPVLDALETIRGMGVWIEVTTLLIPGLNTDTGMLRDEARWIRESLGRDTPLHLSAFHPDFKMFDRERTDPATLHQAREIAMDEGLLYVYEGNVHSPDGGNTHCPGCGKVVVRRDWFRIVEDRVDEDGNCPSCGHAIPIVR